MKLKQKTLTQINRDIRKHKALLNRIHKRRQEVRGYSAVPLAERGSRAAPVQAMLMSEPGKRTFKLLAQGDSWFDYPPGTDLIDCLSSRHGHAITNIAVAGSTLNDEAYGPVPRELAGLPVGPKQSNDPDRITELVNRIKEDTPQGLLISAGGNDIAGDEFFSFVNNAKSGLQPVNQEVLEGVVSTTFTTAYEYLIKTALAASNGEISIFMHGYDYPWPDGRGVFSFLGWKVGPWFDPTFSAKNYPNESASDLQTRHDITAQFIDAFAKMLDALASKYKGNVFHVDLRGTLTSYTDWANELHPTNDGFSALADKFDSSLQENMP